MEQQATRHGAYVKIGDLFTLYCDDFNGWLTSGWDSSGACMRRIGEWCSGCLCVEDALID